MSTTKTTLNSIDTRFWAAVVPELKCSDFKHSLEFYQDILGFSVWFQRLEEKFAYLELERAQFMLEQLHKGWFVAELEKPFGRGVNFQIEIDDAEALHSRIQNHGCTVFQSLQTNWYRDGNNEHGQSEFLIQDPDGYLLRFCTSLGTRTFDSTSISD